MRVVLDTNVLIAALISQGVCSDLLEHCVLRHVIVSSDRILSELRRHLVDKFAYGVAEAEEALNLLRSHMDVVAPDELEQPVCRDPDDDWVLATAVAGAATCLVTGDEDLLILKQYQEIQIVRPADFAEYETSRPE